MLSIAPDPGNALHEYTHHLQAAMPGLDAHFQAFHRRRKRQGRIGQYVNRYFATEYQNFEGNPAFPNGTALEVITRATQLLFHPLASRAKVGGPLWHDELLPRLVRKDPEMLDLTLGLLFRYDPP